MLNENYPAQRLVSVPIEKKWADSPLISPLSKVSDFPRKKAISLLQNTQSTRLIENSIEDNSENSRESILLGLANASQVLLGAAKTAQVLENAITILGESAQFDCIFLFGFQPHDDSQTANTLVLNLSWPAQTPPQIPRNDDLISQPFSKEMTEVVSKLHQGKICIESPAILGQTGSKLWGSTAIQSIALCPLLIEQDLQGMAVFGTTRSNLLTNDSVKPLLPHISLMLGGAITKIALEQKLRHQALHDSLTQLPNRTLFIDRLTQILKHCGRVPSYRFTVLYLDLDRFKLINDSLGHRVGDQLLIQVSQRLETCIRPRDTIARLGGDEFAILLEDLYEPHHILALIERIRQEFLSSFLIHGHEVQTKASIGIAQNTDSVRTPEEILHDADMAMYRAKKSPDIDHEFFQIQFHEQAKYGLILNNELLRSIDRQQIEVFYQPIFSLSPFQLKGFEALARWYYPEVGWIKPDEFIPIAEESNFIIELGNFVFEQVCQQLSQWRQKYELSPNFSVSVNVSPKQISQEDYLETIQSILVQIPIPPKQIKLELTESFFIQNIGELAPKILELRDFDMDLMIDDFGAGYSSLRYLQYLPASTIKIDKAITQGIGSVAESPEIFRTIVALSQNLGLDLIAEGIETQVQLDILTALGCEYGQGFLFAKPMKASIAEVFLAEHLCPND